MPGTLRERKRERTRDAIVEAGTRLFSTAGYDATTIADIAAAADIAPRTFFGYFSSKDELLFPQHDRRISAALHAIEGRRPGERPVEVLLRALDQLGPAGDELTAATTRLRLSLMETVPAVRGRALEWQRRAVREIAAHLQEAYPDELDTTRASALVGAFIGAAAAATDALLSSADPRSTPLAQAVAYALGHSAE